MIAGRLDELDNVTADFFVRMHRAHSPLAFEHFRRGGDRFEVVDGMPQLQPLQHGDLRFLLRIAQAQPHQKPVQLRLRQRKRPFVINRVLGGDEKKGRRQIIIDAVGGDFLFRHRLQQRGLRAGRGAVDFIGQHDLGEERAGPELEVGGLGIENGTARDIVGQ